MTEDRNRRLEKKKSKSSIINALCRLSETIGNKIKEGFIGKILSGYTKCDQKMRSGFAASLFARPSKVSAFFKKLRFTISEQFEGSKILVFPGKLSKFLLGCKMRLYSAFLMTFSIYTGLTYFLKKYLIPQAEADISVLIFAGVVLLLSVPLFFTSKNLAEALKTSRSGSLLVRNILGIPDEKLDISTSKHGSSYNLAILLGVVVGSLTYFFDPTRIVAALLILTVTALIIAFPETGVLLAVSILPIVSVGKYETVLVSIIALYTFGYVIKLVRGKRVIRFELIDLAFLFFAILILIKGSYDDLTSIGYMLGLLIGAFVSGKLMRTRVWQKRSLIALLFSGAAMSMLLIWQRVAELSGSLFGRSLVLFDYGSVPFFEGNKNIISAFLVICLIFNFGIILFAKGYKAKTVLWMISLLFVGALLLIGSIPVAICGIIALLVFFFIMNDKTLTVFLIGSVAATAGALMIPDNVKKEITSSMFVRNVFPAFSNFTVWDSCIELLKASFFTGVGIGGFEKLYPLYALAGNVNVTDCGSLWIRIICELGIPGVIVFSLILFLLLQNCFEYLKKPLDKSSKSSVAAGLSSLIFLTLVALICDIFSNNCMYYVFWTLITIVCAVIRNDRSEIKKNMGYAINSEYSASIDV